MPEPAVQWLHALFVSPSGIRGIAGLLHFLVHHGRLLVDGVFDVTEAAELVLVPMVPYSAISSGDNGTF